MWGGSCAVWKRRGAFGRHGSWEASESCVVQTSTGIYRRLQESPAACPAPMSDEAPEVWGPPEPGSPGSPPPRLGRFPASGRLLKSESEDSGVEMASNEHSPSTPLGSESSFSLDGFQPARGDPEKSRLGEEPAPRERPPRGLSASKKLAQAVQRSRRRRVPRRSPPPLGRRSASTADLEVLARGAEPRGDPGASQELWEPSAEPLEGDGQPEASPPAPGQGLRYLERVCRLLERTAQLQHAHRQLRQQQAAEGRRPAASAPATPALEEPRRSVRARSSSESQAPAERRRSPAPQQRAPRLPEPPPSPRGPAAAMEAGRRGGRWGRLGALLRRGARPA